MYISYKMWFLLNIFVPFNIVIDDFLFSLLNSLPAKLDGVKTYMRMRRVPNHLQVKVIKWFDYLWLTQKCSDEEKAVSCLPDKLKVIHFFKNSHRSLVRVVVRRYHHRAKTIIKLSGVQFHLIAVFSSLFHTHTHTPTHSRLK